MGILRSLKFAFKDQCKSGKTDLWKNGTDRFHLQRIDFIDEEVVRTFLRQRGKTPAEIEKIIAEAKV